MKRAFLLLALLLLTLWLIRVPLLTRIATQALGEEIHFTSISPRFIGATLNDVSIKTKQATLKAETLTLLVRPFSLFSNTVVVEKLAIENGELSLSIIPKQIDDALALFQKTEEKKAKITKKVTIETLQVKQLKLHSEFPKINLTLPSLTLHHLESSKEGLLADILKKSSP